jgi:hypothetical protein
MDGPRISANTSTFREHVDDDAGVRVAVDPLGEGLVGALREGCAGGGPGE